MSVTQRAGGDRAASRQLEWFSWLRVVAVTAALFTTVLLDFAIRLDLVPADFRRLDLVPAEFRMVGLYGVFALAYVAATLGWLVQRVGRSPALGATVQFGGDILVETALLVVLGYESGLAFALVLFFLTTSLACTWLGRLQGTLFATGAFLLQGVVMVVASAGLLPVKTLAGRPTGATLDPQSIAVNLFVFMFTFYATAWLVASRAERLRRAGERLRAATQDLQVLQAFNEHVIRSMTSALVTTDVDGRITFVNAAAERLLDRPRGELAGESLHALLGWASDAGDDLDLVAPGAPPRRFERDARVAGQLVPLEVALSRLEDRRGTVLGLLFLLEDVTELRALEDEVRLKEKMAAIGEMAAGIAHEIRNPLASISGSVQALAATLELEGDRRRLLEIVLEESRRLDGIVGEFLDFARPRPVERRSADLVATCRDTLTLLRHSEEVDERHELVLDAEERVDAVVDADQVRQVVWNLAKNGLKAMPNGGVLRIGVHLDPLGDALLSVEDEGVGMSSAARERAFQPLVGEFENGMGLGLAIVYRIVKDHEGRVAIDSEVGRGTRIVVRFPAATPPENGSSHP